MTKTTRIELPWAVPKMTVITLSKSTQGWQAIFCDSPVMPNGVALPLPFACAADKEVVKADLRGRFPGAAFVVKANSL